MEAISCMETLLPLAIRRYRIKFRGYLGGSTMSWPALKPTGRRVLTAPEVTSLPRKHPRRCTQKDNVPSSRIVRLRRSTSCCEECICDSREVERG